MTVLYTPGTNNDDGHVMGSAATDKIAFHGSTPIVQATVTNITTTVTGDALAVTVKAVITALGNLGLIATS